MSASYFNTAGTFIVDVNPLESNGPGNLSTPRQIVDVEFLDKSFITPTDAFVVNDDVSTRFVQGFSFTVVDGPYAGAYTVDAGAFAPGATVCQVVGGQTHIPVADIVSTSVPYNFFTGFTTPLISPTTPHNYLVTWQLDGNVTANFSTNDVIQVKRVSYNGDVISRSFTVVSATYSGLGYTNVVTELADPSNITPVLGVSAQSVVVTPYPANAPFGYVQYTVSASATSLMLVGKGAPLFNKNTSWGNAMQANMIHMMEHFAHTSPPVSPMNGQMWFDTTPGPTAGPALNLYSGATWYGVVAEGLPVQGNINMNNFKIANVTNATTTFPYVASSTGWGNNDQEVMNLGTSDALYIAKTGGYNADPLARSGTMTGSLNMSGTAGINFKAAGSGNLTFEATSTGSIVVDGSGSVTVATGNVVATAGSVRVGSGANQVVTQNNAGAAPTITFTTSTTGNNVVNLNNNMLTGLSNAVNPTDAVSQQYADGRYVNITGDTMTGTLAMSGTANITLADGDIVLGTSNNTVSILRNGTAASTIIFDTANAAMLTGNNVINLGSNMITGLSNAVNPTDAVSQQYADGRYVNVTGDTMIGSLILNADPLVPLGAATKQYVDMLASGIIWLSPVQDNCLFNDTLSAPPADDGYTAYHKSFIVAGTGTGAWTGFNGHLMQYNGSTWESTLGRPVAIGDRFGVFMEPDNDDTLLSLPGGGLTGHAGKIATVTGISPYTYSFYVPAEPDALTVIGVPGPAAAQSFHMGHSYTFRGTYGVGTYETEYEWIEFLGPQTLIDGSGLLYAGQTLNVDGNLLSLYNLASTGIIVQTAANTIAARAITGTAGNVVVTNGDGVTNNPTVNLAAVTQGSTGTAFVKVAVDGYGRVTSNAPVATADITSLVDGTYVNVAGDTMTGVLTLSGNPTLSLHAATKQYVDAARVMALAGSVNGTVPANAKILMAITAQPFFIAATPSPTLSYGYADITSSGTSTFDIQKNGVSVGSMTFSVGVNAATFTFGSSVSFDPGDRITIVAPATPDATLADVCFTLLGSLI